MQLTKAARGATEELYAGLQNIDGVQALATTPDATLLSFTIRGADPFAVGKLLRQRGWFADEQKPPPSLHCTDNAVHQAHIADFLGVLKDAVAEIRLSGAANRPKAYGALRSKPLASTGSHRGFPSCSGAHRCGQEVKRQNSFRP